MNPRIVCAANLCLVTNRIILGARHMDARMREQFENLIMLDERCFSKGSKQGFIDQFGKFYTRTEAWKIAEENNQIIRRVGGDTKDGGTLYSENLY